MDTLWTPFPGLDQAIYENQPLPGVTHGTMKRVKRYKFSEANKKSYKSDRYILNRNILPKFGKRQLKEITNRDIERYKNSRRKVVAPATVNRELACIKAIFNKAILWGMTKKNPARGIKLFRENNRRIRFLMPDEIRLLLDNCAPHLKPIVITALNTGMRAGEILGLTWKDVDFDRMICPL